ncbi:MAG: thioesterase family protein [Actinobacteria bacterium]|nr:thioesterase family protein [Actinomycetota bacterium]
MAEIGASEFDSATAMSDQGDGRFTGAIVDGWDIRGNANGGYLLALAVRAMVQASGRPHPVTVTAHYLSPGRPGQVEATTQIVKAGRRYTTVTSSLLTADGREMLRVLGTFGDVRSGSGQPEFVHGSPPDVPPFDECVVRSSESMGFPAGFLDRLDVRTDPATTPLLSDARSGIAEVRGWFAFADHRPSDPLALTLAVDGFPPAVFHLELPTGWVPTVELTVHVRDVPAPGPLRAVFRTRFVTNGMFEEDSELWDSTGRLVALSRQLALVAQSS